jgi:cytosine/adenosine deaminase-related metal-dependent hydrolase
MKIYQADWVVPISSAPVEKGAIAVDGAKIVAVGGQIEIKERFPNVQVKDFGEAAILPGLVNAHTHLELTALRGYLDSVEDDFSSWLIKLAAARDGGAMTAECLANSALCGAIEAARAGVTCIGDIAKHGFHSIAALRAVYLRGISYQENSFALDENIANERFAELKEKVARNRELETDCARVGITPHAPYTVSRKLFERSRKFADDNSRGGIASRAGFYASRYREHRRGNEKSWR